MWWNVAWTAFAEVAGLMAWVLGVSLAFVAGFAAGKWIGNY